mmetsp:Transcript_59189/g.105192  ORF Transcript_59189/g.105192 Transcript_59189/m.105192 type:complete len:393 (+) Transcript_59189:198-1376(+)
MEAADTDGGSEASYESVASEGGYEPASERGRDPLPRIVSASHCVQVFQRLSYASDGVFCVHDPKQDEQQGKSKATAQLRRHNPLQGLPPRIMRFEGAMEAWLEEMPLLRAPSKLVRQYASVNDAAARLLSGTEEMSILRTGNRRATLWYFTLDFLQQLWPCFLTGSGMQIWERALLERGCTIQSTHVEVGQVHAPPRGKSRQDWLKALFAAMQSSKWTPDGEARSLLVKRRLSHASMSIGDAIQIGGELWVVGLEGFKQVKKADASLLLPPGSNLEDDEGEEEEEDESAPPSDTGAAKAKKKKKKKKGGGGGNDGGAGEAAENSNQGAGKGKEKGKGKGKGKDEGKGEKGGGKSNGKGRTAEPGPGGVDHRADRRKLRAQLQAERDRVQGSH